MPQVSLYVDDAMMSKLRQQATAEGVSLSRFVTARLERPAQAATPSGLSGEWFESMYGCLADVEGFELPDRAVPDRSTPLPALG